MGFATFREVVDKRVRFQPPQTEATADNLGLVRGKFQNLADDLAPLVPPGNDAIIAANAIGDACQKVIQAIIYNQEEVV